MLKLTIVDDLHLRTFGEGDHLFYFGDCFKKQDRFSSIIFSYKMV
jgi:hypothetical protein